MKRSAARRKVRALAAAIHNGELHWGTPGDGDCIFCRIDQHHTDHLLHHIRDEQLSGSLIKLAMHASGHRWYGALGLGYSSKGLEQHDRERCARAVQKFLAAHVNNMASRKRKQLERDNA